MQFKTKADKLDIAKLESTPVDLSKLINVVKNDFVKSTEYGELVKKVNNISTTNSSSLVKKTDYNTIVSLIDTKINDHDHTKYITTQDFKILASENLTAQANLASKHDIAKDRFLW